MSKVQVDKVVNLSDDGAPQLTYGAELPVGYGLTGAGGLNITGVVTAASAVFSGNVTIGGTLTYEDVTNIDVVGVSTFAGRMNVNSTINANEGIKVIGVSTLAAVTGTTGTFSGAVSGTTGTFSQKTTVNATLEATEGLNVTAGVGTFASYLDIRTGSSINTNATGGSASGTLHKNTNSGEFAVVSGGTGGNNYLSFYTSASAAPTEKLRIASDGDVIIGGSSAAGYADYADNLTIHDTQNSGITIRSGIASQGAVYFSDATGTAAGTYVGNIIYDHSDNHMRFATSGSEAVRIDTSGRLIIGHTSAPYSDADPLQVVTTSGGTGIIIDEYSASTYGASLSFLKSRSAAVGNTVVQDGDRLADLNFYGNDGAGRALGAQIGVRVDGTPGSDDMPSRIVFATSADGSQSPSERLRINSSGQVRIYNQLYLTDDVPLYLGSSNDLSLFHQSGGSSIIRYNHTVGGLHFRNNSNVDQMVIDSSGRVIVGTSSDVLSNNLLLQAAATDATGSLFLSRFGSSIYGSYLRFCKSRNSTIGSHTIVQDNDILGAVDFTGSDGSAVVSGARIQAVVDGTPGSSDMPGRIEFHTTPDGSTSLVQRMQIASNGDFLFKKTSADQQATGVQFEDHGLAMFTKDNIIAYFTRTSSDGQMIRFYGDTTSEGSINISGSSISYNGGVLTRWSQLVGISTNVKSDRPTIYQGTVMSNLDEMCEWTGEENMQLNKTQVSTASGDRNVAGVFWSWDDDDDTYTNDFYVAQTGDFIVRVGAATTITRGDLLESAGDGTAKPQSDDIVRSKTVAKVTSGIAHTTYPDGTKTYPCVLMAS